MLYPNLVDREKFLAEFTAATTDFERVSIIFSTRWDIWKKSILNKIDATQNIRTAIDILPYDEHHSDSMFRGQLQEKEVFLAYLTKMEALAISTQDPEELRLLVVEMERVIQTSYPSRFIQYAKTMVKILSKLKEITINKQELWRLSDKINRYHNHIMMFEGSEESSS